MLGAAWAEVLGEIPALEHVAPGNLADVWHALLTEVLLFLPRLITGTVIFLFFWVLAAAAHRIIRQLRRLERVAPELSLLLARTAKVGLLLFGLVTALDTLGIHVTVLVTGLGLTGFALGFALKDIISNALSGMLILIFRPFKQGDLISVFSSVPFEGTVIDINFRYTVLNAGDKRFYIPNSILSTNAVTVKTPPETSAAQPPPVAAIS